MAPTQDNRLIQISTTLGKDVLLLQSFSGQEGVSTPFHFDLTVNSLNKDIQFDQIVGKPATIKIVLPKDQDRFINGVISSFTLSGVSGVSNEFAIYQATLCHATAARAEAGGRASRRGPSGRFGVPRGDR